MTEDNLYVIIPAYEPDNKMLEVIDDIKSQTNFKIIVVNDGSNKDKDVLFKEAENSAVVLVHEINKGKGAGIKTALSYIESITDCENEKCGIIIVDADGQHKVNDVIRISSAMKKNPDSVILGCRKFTGKIPFRSKFGNNITKFVFSFAAGVKVSDTQTGLRGFSVKLIPFMKQLKGDRYEYEMNMLLECARENIEFFEVPIETVYIGKNETSHFNPIKDSWRIYKDILKFSCSSLLSFCVDYLLYSIFLLLSKNLYFSNIGARVISSAFNFGMNKKFVFKNKDHLGKTAVKYFLLATCILTINTILLKLCVNYIIYNKFISKIVVEIILFFFSWAVQKSFVFKHKERNDL